MQRFAATLLCIFTIALTACARNEDSLAPYQGRWLVINYWATWCKPCREEIVHLNEFAKAHAEKIAVIGINFDGVVGDELSKQAAELGIAFALLADDPAQSGHWKKPDVLPTTLILDPQGNVKKTMVGPQTRATLEAAVTDAKKSYQTQ